MQKKVYIKMYDLLNTKKKHSCLWYICKCITRKESLKVVLENDKLGQNHGTVHSDYWYIVDSRAQVVKNQSSIGT